MWSRSGGWPYRKLPGLGWLIVCVLIVAVTLNLSGKLFFKGFFRNKNVNVKIPVITCTTDDLKDTPFINEVKNNETVLIPNARTLVKLTREEMAALYHRRQCQSRRYYCMIRYVENLQYFCKRIIRLGRIEDGGWDVCDDDKYRPRSPCLVYSFGINNDFTFDDAVIKEYGCEVHSFDPSMNTKSYQRSKLNYFHNLGLASQKQVTKEGWELQDLGTIQANLKHTKRNLTILKMDIETWEWDVLPGILSGDVANRISNFLVEVHLNLYPHSSESNREDYLRALKNLKLLYDKGFRIFRTHRNPTNIFISKCKKIERANCHELHLVRVAS